MVVVPFGVGERFSILEFWSGSLSSLLFADSYVTYLQPRGTEFRRIFYLVLIYTQKLRIKLL